ncbi:MULTISPECIES: hypothetical protein [Frankia]|nr:MULTISPECIES: hypothetical protein [Frankia]
MSDRQHRSSISNDLVRRIVETGILAAHRTELSFSLAALAVLN